METGISILLVGAEETAWEMETLFPGMIAEKIFLTDADELKGLLSDHSPDMAIVDPRKEGFSTIVEKIKELSIVPVFIAEYLRGPEEGSSFPGSIADGLIVKDSKGGLYINIVPEIFVMSLNRYKRSIKVERRFRDFVERLPIGLFRFYPDGRTVEVNRAVKSILGMEKEEDVFRFFNEQVFPGQRMPSAVPMSKRRVKMIEVEVEREDGTKFWAAVNAVPVVNEKREGVCIEGSIMDITERKKAEQEREVLKEQLYHAGKMEALGRISAGVAHDFNNLLTTIIGNADLAVMEIGGSSPAAENINDIRRAAERAAGLARQLLAFSRKDIRKPQCLNLNEVVRAMEKMLSRLIPENIRITTVLDPELESVFMDPSQMDQVIMNLVINARDAMPNGGDLTIETANRLLDEPAFKKHGVEEKPGRYVMLSVTDTGIGMDDEVRSRMFEPFFTTKPRTTGTGLGLATVFGIVKQNNGFIWSYSEKDLGTCMKVYLPVCDKGKAKKEHVSFHTSQPAKRYTILVAEDEDPVREVVEKTLRRQGFTVYTARNGRDAIKIFESTGGRIDLLITDMVMPEMEGKELTRILCGKKKDLPVIYMSGYSENVISLKGILEDGSYFLQKPFSASELLHKVTEVTGVLQNK